MIRNHLFLRSVILLVIFMMLCDCSPNRKSAENRLPDKIPLETGNAWIYKNITYNPYGLTLSVEYDTVNIIGKYQDYYKSVTNTGRIALVNRKDNKYLTYGYIQPADTIHGRIRDGDSVKYSQARIFKQDTVFLDKPVVTAIFNSDTGYISEESMGNDYTFTDYKDSFHVSTKKDFKFKGENIHVYIYSYRTGHSGYKSYKYYGRMGLIYQKTIGSIKNIIIDERILIDTLNNFYLKNIKSSDSNRYF